MRAWPKFIEAAAKGEGYAAHLEALEDGIEKFNELANTDAVWLERYDQICALLAREDLTVKQGMVDLLAMMLPWHIKLMTGGGA